MTDTTRRSVDVRTRPFDAAGPATTAEFFTGTWAEAMQRNATTAAADAQSLGLRPLTLVVDGEPWTLEADDHSITARPGHRAGAAAVTLDTGAFADLVVERRSALGLVIAGRCHAAPADNDTFCAWDAVLRSALDGRSLYRPGDVSLLAADGTPLDLAQRFRLDDDPDVAGHFLAEAGFCVLEGVFGDDEMDAVDAEFARAVAAARPDDGTSWWATTGSGDRYPCRILDLAEQSPTVRALLEGDQVARIAALLGDGHRPGDPFGEHFSSLTVEGLVKRVDSVEGFSVLPWHKDCSRGGHSMYCCGLTLGICLTPVDEAHGGLDVVAGSHRANLGWSHGGVPRGLPAVSLAARRGDVSVHCSCTVHRSTHPTTTERRVAYSGLALPLRAGDRHDEVAQARLRRERAAVGNPTMGDRFAPEPEPASDPAPHTVSDEGRDDS